VIYEYTRCIKTYKGYQNFTSSLLRYDHQKTTRLYEITEYTRQNKSYYDVLRQGMIKRRHHEVCYNDQDTTRIHQRIFYYNQSSCPTIQMLRRQDLLNRLKASCVTHRDLGVEYTIFCLEEYISRVNCARQAKQSLWGPTQHYRYQILVFCIKPIIVFWVIVFEPLKMS